jgi:protoheme IX farnesyltransferase
VAQDRLPSLTQTLAGLGGLGLSAGGAAALNMWYDRDIDAVMKRTAGRPLPAGLIRPVHALVFALALGAASVLVLGLWENGLAAGLSATGYLYYGVVYTMGLKLRTPQNIVIGGGAGAFPPLVGFAVVTGHLSITSWLLFVVILFWTPSHFWGLALCKNDDYARAGVPMMPAVRGARATKRQMAAYAVLLAAVSLVLAGYLRAGWMYACLAAILDAGFLWVHLRLWRDPEDSVVWARRTFLTSLLYLPVLFAALAIGSLV